MGACCIFGDCSNCISFIACTILLFKDALIRIIMEKIISDSQRTLNIISKALKTGMPEFNPHESISKILEEAEAYLIANTIAKEAHCQVYKDIAEWTDGKGFDYTRDGIIIPPTNELFYHSKVLDSEGNVIMLYHDPNV